MLGASQHLELCFLPREIQEWSGVPGLTPEQRLGALTASLNTDTSLVSNNSPEEFPFPLTMQGGWGNELC